MLKILVVDDSKAVQTFIKHGFSKTSHQLTQVFDGEEALAVLEKGSQFDLILLDWEMPKLSGPETLAELKRKAISIPVIMMTTRNSMADIQKMIEAGVSDYMMKPFTQEILFEKIQTILGVGVVNAA